MYRHNLAGAMSPKNLKQASIEANYGSTLFASIWIDPEPTAVEACWCPSSSMLAPFFPASELSLVSHDIPSAPFPVWPFDGGSGPVQPVS